MKRLGSRVLAVKAAAVLFGGLILPVAAQASCYITGPIVRVTNYADAYSSTGCYIYMRNSALSSYYYYARSTDDDICSIATTAATTGVDVSMSGNAASCPTSGTGRNMGDTDYLIINP